MSTGVLRYPGGKTRAIPLIDKIIQLYEFKIDVVLSPFVGGASFELHLSNQYDSKVICNDKFKPLYLFWHYLKTKSERLISRIEKLHPLSKNKFASIQTKLTDHDISRMKRAAYYFAINRSSFSGTTMSGGYSAEAAKGRFNTSAIKRLTDINLDDLTFYNMDVVDFLEGKDKDTFIFADPPYMLGSKLYGVKGDLHDDFDHKQLRDTLMQHNNWVLCYNNTKRIRKLYKGVGLIVEVSWKYGMNSSKDSNEILIIRKNGEVPPLLTQQS